MELTHLWKSILPRPGRKLRRPRTRFSPLASLAAEVLEYRQLLSAAAPQMSLTLVGNNLTLSSTDINNPNVTITRSGSFVVFTGSGGTQITYTNNGSKGTTQSIPLASLNNLTVNLGTGSDTIAISGLSTTGSITINGQQTGAANVSISAGTPAVTIGGSILANFGGETATFNVFGSGTTGANLTVNGSINVTEGGAGNKQVNVAGPPLGFPNGGKLIVTGNLSVVDTGTGQSGLHVDDGVTIGGNLSFDNSSNTVNSDTVQIFSNSAAYGVTSIAGSLSLSLANSLYYSDSVVIQGFGSQLPVTGATTIKTGAGTDSVELLNTWFKNTVTVDTGSSQSYGTDPTIYQGDQVIVQGSRFDGATRVTMTGPYAALGLGTLATFVPTVFNSTFTALMTGPSATAFISNPTSTVNQVVFNSTAAFTGGTPTGYYHVQGRYFVGSGKLTLTNFTTTAPTTIKPKVSVTVSGNNVTVTSTDINNPNVSITRSGNFIVFTGTNNTQITYTNNGTTGTTQTIPLASVNNLTINLGTGFNTYSISGLNLTGDLAINGQGTGTAVVSISAAAASITIGGSIQANFAGESAVLNLLGSSTIGANLTVNGSVNVTEGGAGNKQVNVAGPPLGSPNGGKLAIKGSLTVLDTGNGKSGLHVDDGVMITGNLSYDNAANTVHGDSVQIFSNSLAYGTTSIGGTLSLALANAVYSGDSVTIQGFGTQLPVTGEARITSGNGADSISLLNSWFKSAMQVNSGSSPSFSPDVVTAQGTRFDKATIMTLSGPYAQLGLGTLSTFAPVVFNDTFTALMTGPSASVFLSNPFSTVNQVVFNSTALFVGGSPAGTIFQQGRYFVLPGRLQRVNFNLA